MGWRWGGARRSRQERKALRLPVRAQGHLAGQARPAAATGSEKPEPSLRTQEEEEGAGNPRKPLRVKDTGSGRGERSQPHRDLGAPGCIPGDVRACGKCLLKLPMPHRVSSAHFVTQAPVGRPCALQWGQSPLEEGEGVAKMALQGGWAPIPPGPCQDQPLATAWAFLGTGVLQSYSAQWASTCLPDSPLRLHPTGPPHSPPTSFEQPHGPGGSIWGPLLLGPAQMG